MFLFLASVSKLKLDNQKVVFALNHPPINRSQ